MSTFSNSNKTDSFTNSSNNQQTPSTSETIAQVMLKKHQQRSHLSHGKSSSTGELKVGPFARIKESEKKRSSIPAYDSDDDDNSSNKKN
uniref:PEST proteolytic signal-containing nuclear protein n=1 Tax=Strongyloides venezuelensis TaxID=75913 RepID=A0A0K0F8F5_STRVS